MYFSLLIEGAPFVGHDANDHNLLLKGAPFYNAISPIDEFTSELLVPSQAGICLVLHSMD